MIDHEIVAKNNANAYNHCEISETNIQGIYT